MDNLSSNFKITSACIGGLLGWLLGGLDSLIYALIAFVAVDYATGVLLAIYEKKVSSQIGFEGISRKVLIFVLVALGNTVDRYIIGSNSSFRTMLITFYLSNEGISILENCAKMGVPFPEKLRNIFLQITKTVKD